MGALSFLTILSAATSSLAAVVTSPRGLEPVNFNLRELFNETLTRRQSTNYNQDYTTGGSVSYSPNGNSYSVTWSNPQDFVVGRGWNPGNSDPITFSGSFSCSSGSGRLTVYGWTTNPLIEYYIIENYASNPGSGTQKGTVTSDGSSYQIWQNQRTNQPSIQGTSTFQQFISVRSSTRSSGTVTVANHFNAWANLGMKLGTQNFQVLAVEAWNGAGSSQQTLSKGTSSGTPAPAPAPGPAPAPAPGGSSSGTVAKYGQCGGQGYTGATTCASGSTCQVQSQWYSQCL